MTTLAPPHPSRREAAGSQTVQRALRLLDMLVAGGAEGGGGVTLSAAAARLALPLPTAYRLARDLQDSGLLVRTARGRYAGGLALRRLARDVDADAIVAGMARPLLRTLSAATGRVAHLGIFAGDMVTYLVREGPARADVFTREGMQLEAYCTAVGKILLAALPHEQREAYLATGPFVPLTPRTLIDADVLRAHLATVAQAGFARDDEEISEGLCCVAVPIGTSELSRRYALSLSGPLEDENDRAARLQAGREAAALLAGMIEGATPDARA